MGMGTDDIRNDRKLRYRRIKTRVINDSFEDSSSENNSSQKNEDKLQIPITSKDLLESPAM